jgi:centrin-1
MPSDHHQSEQQQAVFGAQGEEEINMVDVGNGETIPEVIYTYEKNTEGKILRKKKRLVKKQMKGLSDVQKQEIDGAFKLFDRDGSGNIDFYELRDAMRALGIQLTKDQVKVMMSEIDQDNNGFIDQDEFRLLMTQKLAERDQEEELRKAFRVYDQDDTGLIEFYDLRRVADELSEGKKESEEISDEVIFGMIYEACGDRKGVINLAQFMRIMKKGKLY